MPPNAKKSPPRKNAPPRASGGGNRGGNRGGRRPPAPPTVGRPKPWGMISLVVVIVLFAGLVIGYAVFRVNKSSQNGPDAKASDAKAIPGITVKDITDRNHVTGVVNYPDSPPMGGNHDPTWADCSGTVYPDPIRNENAVHMLEHGAVWITYRPDLSADQVDALKKKVDGVNYMAMSPYPGLKSAVSLQSWGHQLFVDSATDARVDRFIDDLRLNQSTTPEFGATCSQPSFKANPIAPDPTGAAAPSASASG
jgi:hypothetical protein